MENPKKGKELRFRDFFDLSRILRQTPGEAPYCLLCDRVVGALSNHGDRCPGSLFGENMRAVWVYSDSCEDGDATNFWNTDLRELSLQIGRVEPENLVVEIRLDYFPEMRDPDTGMAPVEWVNREVDARKEERDRLWRAKMELQRVEEERKRKANAARKAWATLNKLKPDLTPEAFERRRSELHTRFPEAEFNPGRKPPKWRR